MAILTLLDSCSLAVPIRTNAMAVECPPYVGLQFKADWTSPKLSSRVVQSLGYQTLTVTASQRRQHLITHGQKGTMILLLTYSANKTLVATGDNVLLGIGA